MIFPERKLKSYAEPVRDESLVVGNIYFVVQFCDPDMIVPTLEPVVFVGRHLFTDEPGLYFQDADSYLSGARHDNTRSEEASIWCQPPNQITHIFEYESAIDVLLRCAVRRADKQ